MAYLGRPSGGDSPFAIGDRAMRDTSSPQPPSQRNPTPRQQQNMPPPGGFMATPSPYGSASDEARRRYEERYAKKKAEEAAKAQAANSPQPPQQQQPPPQQQQQYHRPPPQQQNHGPPGGGGYGQHPQQQTQGYNAPPPRQQYASPPPQQGGFDPRQQQQQQYQQGPPGQGGYGQRPNSMGRPPQGYQSPPPPPQHQQGPPPQQRWSQSSNHQQYNQPPPVQQQQQWQQSHSPPPPPPQQQQGTDDAELQRMFSQFDSSRTGDLSAYDLQRLLAKDTMMDAREDAVKMLMNIFDTDKSGTINFMEFEGLYRYIQDWHGIFRRFDRDNSGLIDRKELHNALLGFGFSLPKEMVILVEKRFAPPPTSVNAQQNKGISFDRFLMACVTVKHYTEGFRRLDVNGQGHITLDYNQFMELVLDAPS
ncbi:hypothetical protein I302_105644 [Kwoniella bestiolae CBS 10118]|uniref:EF-hand domain-containing protein n=1 Tax=Kwoniella bestiolae CBS 10118 TaxID=1296100 RepID=A0AAJ8M9B0_9TREE